MCICYLTCKRSAWADTMSSDMRILRLMVTYNISWYSVLANPLIRDPRRRLHGKQFLASRINEKVAGRCGEVMRNRGRTRQEGEELTRRKGRKWGEASEWEKRRAKGQGERARRTVREGEETSGGNHRGVSSVPPTRLRRPVCHSFELISWMFPRLSRTP